jgi:F420H(2)-dependent quinone reductase
MADWNAATIQEFHAKAGKGIGPFGDQLMLLTTVGARSGDERVTPVMYHRDGERYVVIASKGERLTILGGITTSRRIPWPGWRWGRRPAPRRSR